MLSLKVQTALRIIDLADYRFEELLALLDNPSTDDEALLSHVAQDDEFWRGMIIHFHGRERLDKRLDILPDQWKAYAISLYLNCVSFYTLVTPIDSPLGNFILLYHGPEDDESKADIVRGFRVADGHTQHMMFRLRGPQPLPGCLGYGVQSNFNGNSIRCAIFVCHEESQLPTIFDQMLTHLAVRIMEMCQANLELFPAGTRILDVVFNEAPTIEIVKAVLLKFLGLGHLLWNLNPERFGTYDHSSVRVRRLRAYGPGNEVILEMSIGIAELVFT